MSLSGKEPKGKRPASEMVEYITGAAPPPSTPEESTSRDAGKQLLVQQQVNSCEEVGHHEIRPPQVAEGTYSSLSFTELLTQKGKACLEIYKSDESDEEKSGASVSMPNPSSRRGGCQLRNLDLSLLPPREPLELFGTSQKTTGHIDQAPQQNPFPGLRPPSEGVSPAKFSAFSKSLWFLISMEFNMKALIVHEEYFLPYPTILACLLLIDLASNLGFCVDVPCLLLSIVILLYLVVFLFQLLRRKCSREG